MGNISRRRFVVLSLATATGTLLAACRGPAPPVGTGATAVSPAAAPRPGPSGTLRVALPTRTISLDPHGADGPLRMTHVIAQQLFDSLVERSPDARTLHPGLATAWEATDERTWEFALRRGVRFHDGTPLTARDVRRRSSG
jgi:peptide/nickel transport system substrate-binding protein